MTRIIILFGIAIGLIWFWASTPIASSAGHSEYLINWPWLFGGWAAVVAICLVLSKLSKRKKDKPN
jgi:hypothetical protein